MDGVKIFMLQKLMDNVVSSNLELTASTGLSLESKQAIREAMFRNACKTLHMLGLTAIDPGAISEFARILNIKIKPDGGLQVSEGQDGKLDDLPDEIVNRFTNFSM